MSDVWERLAVARSGADGPEPAEPAPGGWRFRFPNTLRTVFQDGSEQAPVFEPALLHFPNAFRAADPRFADERLVRRWLAARREALDLVLAAVSGGEYAEELMLRGSALMSCWYPGAREPGDLDFVVLARDREVSDPRTDALFADVARTAEQLGTALPASGVRIDASGAVSDDIWTYERVPGRRLMLPWAAEGIPGGWVQVDFVFGEDVRIAPERARVALFPGHAGVPLRVASKQLSLAWKLVWLLTDMHPQGKDLYDAVLLAEDTPLDYAVLREELVAADEHHGSRPISLADLSELDPGLGWDHFQGEYPSVEGPAEDWLLRLGVALEPTFTLLEGRPATAYELEAAWIEPLTARIAAATGDRGEGLQRTLLLEGVKPALAVVITRELVGRVRMSVAEAVRVVLSHPGRWDAAASHYGHLWQLEKAAHAYGLDLRMPWPEHLADTRIVAQVEKAFGRRSTDSALEILAPLATDPDPHLSDAAVLSAVVELGAGRLDLLHYAVQRARSGPDEIIRATRRV